MFNLNPDTIDGLYNYGIRLVQDMAVSFSIFFGAGLICERLGKRGKRR